MHVIRSIFEEVERLEQQLGCSNLSINLAEGY